MSEPKPITNPFPGLRPFETDEYRLFFGREGQSDALIERLQRSRFLAVVGTSGSGKSSLIRAGMLPALRGGMMAGAGAGWRVAVMRPGHDPIGNLARELASDGVLAEVGAGLPASEAEAVVEATLRRGSLGLVDAARRARLASGEKLLVVVDQFEELFRFRAARAASSTDDDASAFVKLLLEASRQRDVPVYVVLTMRSDFLGDCAQFQGLPEAINDGQYLIPRMTRDERRFAIVGPVRVARGRMSEPLVNRLLNDVGDNPDQLPILQHALMRTWDYWQHRHRDGEPIGIEHYEAVGTMANALSHHADEAWDELPDERSRRIAETLFKALTERGADNREIRRPTRLREICEIAGASAAETVAVIEVFRHEGRSFLMPPAEVEITSETIIDISHESLIRNWERLKEWVRDEAEAARIYRRLAEGATAYNAGEGGLLDDVTLQWVLKWRDKYAPNRAWGVRYHPEFDATLAYLEESRAARAAAVQERERQRREMLESERREREHAERFAAEQVRAARRLRIFAVAMAGMFVIAAAAFITAIFLEMSAERARQYAELASRKAYQAREKLQKSRTALTLIQSYQMEQAEKELNDFYRMTANDEEGHKNRAWVLYNLGDLNRRLERHDQAAAFFQSALHTEMMIHGKLGIESVGTLDSLAHTLEEAGRYDDAVAEFELLSDLLTDTASQNGVYFRLNTANVYKDLADLYLKQAMDTGSLERNVANRDAMSKLARQKAKVQYQKALNVWEDVLKDDPEALADKYAQIADSLISMGNSNDVNAVQDLQRKSMALRGENAEPLTHKSIDQPNPGNDNGINTKLTSDGPGYTVFNQNWERTYGHPETINLVKTVAAAWAERHPDIKLVVADISRQGGGPFPPHSSEHQDGRAVDIWPLTNNGVAEPTNIYAPNYSRDLTEELIKIIQQMYPNAVIHFDDPPLVAAGLVKGTFDHNNYMHVLLP